MKTMVLEHFMVPDGLGLEMYRKWYENDNFGLFWGSGRPGAGNVSEMVRKQSFRMILGLRTAWGRKAVGNRTKTIVLDHFGAPDGLGPETCRKTI